MYRSSEPIAALAALADGMEVFGNGVPLGTTITNINVGGNTLTLSNAATLNGASTLTFGTGSLQYGLPASGGASPTASVQNALNALPSVSGLNPNGVTVTQVHTHATALMAQFLKRLAPLNLKGLIQRDLITPFGDCAAHGNFLCFRAPHAAAIERALAAADIHADHRGDRMRFRFGLATTIDDVDAAITRMTQILPTL